MASAIPISPARTPCRAVRGWLNHFSDRMNRAAATMYEPVPSQELAAASNSAGGAAAKRPNVESALITFGRLPAEHLEHAIGDPKTTDDVRRGRDDAQRAKYRIKSGFSLGHDLNAGHHGDRRNGVRERHQRRVQ